MLYFTARVSRGYPQGGDGGGNCQAPEERRCGSQDPVCKCAVQGLSYDYDSFYEILILTIDSKVEDALSFLSQYERIRLREGIKKPT